MHQLYTNMARAHDNLSRDENALLVATGVCVETEKDSGLAAAQGGNRV